MKRTRLKPGKPLERKTPLPRSWFKSTRPSWRTSRAYREAVTQAFEPYTRADGWVRCVLCDTYFPPSEITPSHIKGVGAWAHLRSEPLNIMPNCFTCHGKYEGWSERYQMKRINEIFPGREEELLALARSNSRR